MESPRSSSRIGAVFGVQAGIFVVLFPYFQAVLGWSALRSTLALTPTALLTMFASGLVPRVAARAGSRSTMALGILVSGAGLTLMASLVSVDGDYLSILPGMLAVGLGMRLTMTPAESGQSVFTGGSAFQPRHSLDLVFLSSGSRHPQDPCLLHRKLYSFGYESSGSPAFRLGH